MSLEATSPLPGRYGNWTEPNSSLDQGGHNSGLTSATPLTRQPFLDSKSRSRSTSWSYTRRAPRTRRTLSKPSIHDPPEVATDDAGCCSIDNTGDLLGTLIINLPSKHEGGSMVFEYANQKPRTYRTCSQPQSFAFWYTGVSHRLSSVTSGYRCVLVLKFKGPRNQLPSGLISPADVLALRNALGRWLATSSESRKYPYFYWLLEQDYFSADGQYHLQEEDLGRAQLLRETYGEPPLPMEAFVGTFEEEVVPRKRVKNICRIKTLVDLDDHLVARDLPIREPDKQRILNPEDHCPGILPMWQDSLPYHLSCCKRCYGTDDQQWQQRGRVTVNYIPFPFSSISESH